ncbi:MULTISPECIES: HNH endonuclease [Burkholderia]|uniref:HNH endonuclease n=1 Tax=Burkholderia TaxID=32008 RepID=UPI0011A0AB97|nr:MULTISPECIES: HNH endonuclease [Burkholderia]MDN7740720.1 HNH endonuclease [Burkholderia gladioli]
MKKFETCAVIEATIQNTLNAVPDVEKESRWEGRTVAVTQFKECIHDQGLVIQGERCAWCTLFIGERGRRTAHRDHIAPKSRYPQWTFTPENLVLACEYCNGFAVKSDLDTVADVGPTYDSSTFFLVHPYIDEPHDHIEFALTPENHGVVIRAKNGSTKGVWTIENLKLDSPGLTQERAKDALIEEDRAVLPDYYRSLFDQATDIGN